MTTNWPHFSHGELECRCGCGRMEMQDEFMRKLEVLRVQAGFPFPVTSGYRCPSHNCAVSSTGNNGPHTTGRAVDISIWGSAAFKLVQKALESHAFSGIGVKQKGPLSGRFIHLDDIDSDTRPRIWSY